MTRVIRSLAHGQRWGTWQWLASLSGYLMLALFPHKCRQKRVATRQRRMCAEAYSGHMRRSQSRDEIGERQVLAREDSTYRWMTFWGGNGGVVPSRGWQGVQVLRWQRSVWAMGHVGLERLGRHWSRRGYGGGVLLIVVEGWPLD